MAHWEEAYEKQMSLGKFWSSPAGIDYGVSFYFDVLQKERPGADTYKEIAAIEYGKMAQANPIYVDEDMFDLWEHATQTFEPEPLMPSDLVTLGGFAYLPKPQIMFDISGKAMSYRAIAWTPTIFKIAEPGKTADDYDLIDDAAQIPKARGHEIIEKRLKGGEAPGLEKGDSYGLHVSLYSSIHDEDDFNSELRELIAQYPRHPLAHQDLSMCHAQSWAFGDSYEEVLSGLDKVRGLEGPEEVERTRLGAYDFWRKLQSLFRLMGQKITTHTELRPPRGTRRRAKKMEWDEDKNVTVIRLRRADPKREQQGDVQEVNWTHRWLVDAHWRNQWYPSIKAHRQIWIAPHIKGPEDKELRIKEKAYELVR
jgi:hypothetical protein